MKTIRMTSLYSLFFCCILSLSLSAQWTSWGEPEPLSDSVSDNTDATVNYVPFYDGEDYYMFWQRSGDSLSTDIYARNYYEKDDPVPVVHEGDHHYTNPGVVAVNDTTFLLLYESDENGNIDIYVTTYTPSGFSGPQQITSDTADDTHMDHNLQGGLVWENQGRIKYTYIKLDNFPVLDIADPLIMSDSGSHPVMSKNSSWNPDIGTIAWIDGTDSNNAIVYSEKTILDSVWSDPSVLYDSGYIENLNFGAWFWDMSNILIWDRTIDGETKMAGYDFWDASFFHFSFSQERDFQPAILSVPIIVQEQWWQSFITFCYDVGDTSEIFVNDYYYYSPHLDNYFNLTESWQEDRNPELFIGDFHDMLQDFILIWESYRNGHWQLWGSFKMEPLGGQGEKGFPAVELKVFPNPFSGELSTNLTLDSPQQVAIKILDIYGRTLFYKDYGILPEGETSLPLEMEPANGNMPSGVYLLQCSVGNSTISKKIIRQ